MTASANGLIGGRMTILDVEAAETELSRLIDLACAGVDVVIVRDAERMVRLVPVTHTRRKRVSGSMAGQFRVPEAFFDSLPPDEVDAWER